MSAQDMFQVGAGSRPGERNFWIGVVAGDDGQHASQGGFSQFGYGKVQSLARMKAGDGFVGYAPNAAFRGRGPLPCFTAIGVVRERLPYFFGMSGFAPHHDDIDWADSIEAPVRPWLDSLEFAEGNRNWDQKLRFGHLALSERDFRVIAQAMHADLGLIFPRVQAFPQQLAG
ncbi:EVE domain-containing protein [Ensifer sp. B1-9]|jgi:hypothetical protein|uniref:EVE domain-containing protein n=1 Tax=Ensifer sp. B1-9 TaxID=3141455 RepID=UPI003D25CC9B